MERLEEVVNRLSNDGIQGELWLNGSFLTEKIDPQDLDCVLRLSSDFVDNSSPAQKATLDWFSSNLRNSHLCDTYVFVEFPISDGRFATGEFFRKYWEKQFGFSRGSDPKGIAAMAIPAA